MKTKIFLFGVFLSLFYFACEDALDTIGRGIQPDEDQIEMFDEIIDIDATTVKWDSVYAKTTSVFLGSFYDQEYGDIKAGYICQYYPSVGFSDSMIGTQIDSVYLRLYYTSYVGDSLTPMEVSVYPVVKPLVEDYYTTSIKPDEYCNMNNLWAKKTYTARDLNVSDSINKLTTYYKNILIALPKEVGQDLYDKYIAGGGNFGSLKNFTDNVFPGTYFKSTFGTGNIIQVDATEMYVFYQRNYTVASVVTGQDSIYQGTSAAVLSVTKEVTQLNCISNDYDANLLTPSDDKMYLKSPSGIFSKIIIPIPKIITDIGQKKFSSVQLKINAYSKHNVESVLPYPGWPSNSTSQSKLLLIEVDSVKSFFETQKVADSRTSYTAIMDTISNSYSFNNIASLVQNAIEKKPNENLELLLIPVLVESYFQQSGYSGYYIDYTTSNSMFPSAVTLKKGGSNLQIKIVASNMEINTH